MAANTGFNENATHFRGARKSMIFDILAKMLFTKDFCKLRNAKILCIQFAANE